MGPVGLRGEKRPSRLFTWNAAVCGVIAEASFGRPRVIVIFWEESR